MELCVPGFMVDAIRVQRTGWPLRCIQFQSPNPYKRELSSARRTLQRKILIQLFLFKESALLMAKDDHFEKAAHSENGLLMAREGGCEKAPHFEHDSSILSLLSIALSQHPLLKQRLYFWKSSHALHGKGFRCTPPIGHTYDVDSGSAVAAAVAWGCCCWKVVDSLKGLSLWLPLSCNGGVSKVALVAMVYTSMESTSQNSEEIIGKDDLIRPCYTQ